MPNWVNNTLVIRGDEEELREFFNNLECPYGELDGDVNEQEIEDGDVTVEFSSANFPATEWVKKVGEKWSSLEFTHSWCDVQLAKCGFLYMDRGEEEDEGDFEYKCACGMYTLRQEYDDDFTLAWEPISERDIETCFCKEEEDCLEKNGHCEKCNILLSDDDYAAFEVDNIRKCEMCKSEDAEELEKEATCIYCNKEAQNRCDECGDSDKGDGGAMCDECVEQHGCRLGIKLLCGGCYADSYCAKINGERDYCECSKCEKEAEECSDSCDCVEPASVMAI